MLPYKPYDRLKLESLFFFVPAASELIVNRFRAPPCGQWFALLIHSETIQIHVSGNLFCMFSLCVHWFSAAIIVSS